MANTPFATVLKLFTRGTLVVTVIFALALLSIRLLAPYLVNDAKRVESLISARLGLPVAIDQATLHWRGWRPVIRLKDVRVADANSGAEMISFGHVAVELAPVPTALSNELEIRDITLFESSYIGDPIRRWINFTES